MRFDKSSPGYKQNWTQRIQKRKIPKKKAKNTVKLTWIRNCKMAVDDF
jgi:hypothetical protein